MWDKNPPSLLYLATRLDMGDSLNLEGKKFDLICSHVEIHNEPEYTPSNPELLGAEFLGRLKI